MRSFRFARHTVLFAPSASVSLYTRELKVAQQVSASHLVSVNEDLPAFKEQYQQLLKKFNYTADSDEGKALKESAKARFVGLELAREQGKDWKKLQSNLEALETAYLAYTPKIHATVDEAFDSKDHVFITDPIGAEIFRAGSEFIDKQDFMTGLMREHLGITPRRLAEAIYEKATVGTSVTVSPVVPPPRGDLPAFLQPVLDSFSWGKKIKSTKDFLDHMFESAPLDLEPPVVKQARLHGKDSALALIAAEISTGEHASAPGTDQFEFLMSMAKDTDFTVPGLDEFAKDSAVMFERSQQLKKKWETFLAQPEQIAAAEKAGEDYGKRYSGENGVARKAVAGFLLSHTEPSSSDKVKFMKTLREALRHRRKAHGVVVRELFPSLNLPASRSLDDNALLAKFDEYAASL